MELCVIEQNRSKHYLEWSESVEKYWCGEAFLWVRNPDEGCSSRNRLYTGLGLRILGPSTWLVNVLFRAKFHPPRMFSWRIALKTVRAILTLSTWYIIDKVKLIELIEDGLIEYMHFFFQQIVRKKTVTL